MKTSESAFLQYWKASVGAIAGSQCALGWSFLQAASRLDRFQVTAPCRCGVPLSPTSLETTIRETMSTSVDQPVSRSSSFSS